MEEWFKLGRNVKKFLWLRRKSVSKTRDCMGQTVSPFPTMVLQNYSPMLI